MSFVAEYERLEESFNKGDRSELASLSDVFLEVNGVSDLSAPIGHKLEKANKLAVQAYSGELVVAITCRIIRPDAEMCEDIISLDRFSPWQTQTDPELVSKQIVEWSDGEDFHQSRLWTGFSREALEWGDREWQDYEQELAEWQAQDESLKDVDNEPLEPRVLRYKLLTDLAFTTPQTYERDFRRHFDILEKIAQVSPSLGHLASGTMYGNNVTRTQSPKQFTALVDSLLN